MIDGLFEAIRAKGNGFAVGEFTGHDVVRWYVYLHLRLAVPR